MTTPIENNEREKLIRACAQICLNGLIKEFEERALANGFIYRNSAANHIELTRVLKLFGERKPASTADREITDRLALARLTAGVSTEEWNSIVQISKIG